MSVLCISQDNYKGGGPERTVAGMMEVTFIHNNFTSLGQRN